MQRHAHKALGMLCLLLAGAAAEDARPAASQDAGRAALRAELRRCRHRIVWETYRDGNWELFAMRADGSKAANLTRTRGIHELYPHASPDGKRLSFVVDDTSGQARRRDVYHMQADGTGRKLVARNARQPCWTPDGRIAYLKGEFERFTLKDFATRGLIVFDPATGSRRPHPNDALHHLYNVGFSPDGRWLLATVHGGMGYKHANLAIQARGAGVFPLQTVRGCRPDVSPDGRRIVWNATDQLIALGELELTRAAPRVTNVRPLVTCPKTHEVYHADFSPCGRYVAFAHGPKAGEQVGQIAPGWNICVADAGATNLWVPLTTDGLSNKEPDWLPAAGKKH